MPKPRPDRPKKPPIETTSNKSPFTFDFPDHNLFSIGEKRAHPPSSPENENQNQNQNQNQKPTKKTTKLMPTTASIPSIQLLPLSPEQHLQKALESVT